MINRLLLLVYFILYFRIYWILTLPPPYNNFVLKINNIDNTCMYAIEYTYIDIDIDIDKQYKYTYTYNIHIVF